MMFKLGQRWKNTLTDGEGYVDKLYPYSARVKAKEGYYILTEQLVGKYWVLVKDKE